MWRPRLSLIGLVLVGWLGGTMPGSARLDVDFLGWRGGASANYWQQRDELTRLLDQALPDQQPGRRLDLVRFYLAHGDAPEALGLLAGFAADPEAAPDIVLYRGIAAFLQKRPATALQHFSDKRIQSSPDAKLWRGLAYAELSNWTLARENWTGTDAVLWQYPAKWQARFAAARIQTAFGLNNLAAVERLLDREAGVAAKVLEPDAYRLFEGRLLDALGKTGAALDSYADVSGANDSPIAAEAGFRTLALKWHTGQIELATGRVELRALSPAIDQTRVAHEYHQLAAALAEQDGEPLEAMFHLRLARDRAPTRIVRRNDQSEIDRLMIRTLGQAKLGQAKLGQAKLGQANLGQANKSGLSLVGKVQAFYQLQDLLPIGEAGDEIVLAHARRLGELDLLAPAEELLAHQVAQRLEGARKTSAALDLAEIRLARGDVSRASTSLKLAGYDRLGHKQKIRLKLMRAQVLSRQGDISGALAVLEDLDWDPALKLRADLYLRQGQGEHASRIYRRLLANIAVRGLDPDQAEGFSLATIRPRLALAEALAGMAAPEAEPILDFIALRPVLPLNPSTSDVDQFAGLKRLTGVTIDR